MKELGLSEDIPKVIIVNDRIAKFDYVLKDGDRVSVFPPTSGWVKNPPQFFGSPAPPLPLAP